MNRSIIVGALTGDFASHCLQENSYGRHCSKPPSSYGGVARGLLEVMHYPYVVHEINEASMVTANNTITGALGILDMKL